MNTETEKNDMEDNETRKGIQFDTQTVNKPHITYAAFWLSAAVWMSALIYFGADYMKSLDQLNLELRKHDVRIMELETEQKRIESLSRVEIIKEEKE